MISEFLLRTALRLRALLAKRADDHRGQGLVEYALILAFIAIFVVVALKFLQPTISTQLNNVANGI
jgi:pilus assembly protein Flp/PilA